MKLKIKKAAFDDDRYHDNIKVDFHSDSQKLTFGLKQWGSFVVDQIELDQESIPVSFMIDVESKEWGIKNISLYGIAGKPELDIKVTVFANDKNDEVKTVSTKLPIDWQKIKQDIYENDKTFSLGSLEIYLKNDEKGDLLIDYDLSSITVYHY